MIVVWELILGAAAWLLSQLSPATIALLAHGYAIAVGIVVVLLGVSWRLCGELGR